MGDFLFSSPFEESPFLEGDSQAYPGSSGISNPLAFPERANSNLIGETHEDWAQLLVPLQSGDLAENIASGIENVALLTSLDNETMSKDSEILVYSEQGSLLPDSVSATQSLTPLTVAPLPDRSTLVAGDLFSVPGNASESVAIRFQWTYREAAFNNEIGVFVVDSSGQVNGLLPSDPGYAKAALTSASRQVLFAKGQQTGAWKELKFQGGQKLAFYLIQNSSTEEWLTQNPDNRAGKGPVAFFSIDGVNPDQFDHVHSQSFGEDILHLAWEDLWGGGDQDFNDVHLVVSPVGVSIPGELGQFASLSVDWVSKSAFFDHEMGYFLVDDPQGRIGTLNPGESGYAAAALSSERSQVLFAKGQSPDDTVEVQLPSGKYLGWYLVQNGSKAEFLGQNPQNLVGNGPIVFFSYPGANPDGLSHVHYRSHHEMVWEDMTHGGDRDYDDLVFRFKLGHPPEQPITPPPVQQPPTLSVGDITVLEGDDHPGEATFTVSLSEASNNPVMVDFQTVDGSARANQDYIPLGGSLTFAAGEQAKTVKVTLIGDLQDEDNEQFFLQLSNAVNAEIDKPDGIATIEDDDSPAFRPFVSINDVTVQEGDDGKNEAVFTIDLSETSNNQVAVNYETVDGTAKAGEDFEPIQGTLTFQLGEQRQNLRVKILSDLDPEDSEQFTILLSQAINAETLDGEGIATIEDDDEEDSFFPEIAVEGVTIVESDSDSTELAFSVRLSEAATLPVSVDFSTQDRTAFADQDYMATEGTITFLPGESLSQKIVVSIIGDDLPELDEIFALQLSNPQNAVLVTTEAIGTIEDDDQILNEDILLEENSDFEVGHEVAIIVPSASSVLSISFADLNFDLSDSDFRLFRPDYAVLSGNAHGSKALSLKLSKLRKP
jgi:hypothetical protein